MRQHRSRRALRAVADKVDLLPVNYRPQAIQVLAIADKNTAELLAAIDKCPVEQREALAFLLVHMPPADLQAVKADFLLENIDYAYRARKAVSWGKDLPDELFLNYVVPYANVNERRDNWRKDFFEKFSPAIKECKTPGGAALVLNKAVFAETKVKYHPTKRPKPDQSPYESIEAGYASCTGLSIMLVDACRAVGIPARVVGTQWTNVGGNHTWSEVWDRQWNFLASAEGKNLNKAWFTANAAAADASRVEKRIYAASWAQTGTQFPLIWAPDYKDAPATDVTSYYTARAHAKISVLDKPSGQPQKVTLAIRDGGALVAAGANDSNFEFDLAHGKKYVAEITPAGRKPLIREITLPAEGAADVSLYLAN